jgi:hypothetical protein
MNRSICSFNCASTSSVMLATSGSSLLNCKLFVFLCSVAGRTPAVSCRDLSSSEPRYATECRSCTLLRDMLVCRSFQMRS